MKLGEIIMITNANKYIAVKKSADSLCSAPYTVHLMAGMKD